MTATTPPTYRKRVGDLLPNHIVLATNGDRLRVLNSRRVRRNLHDVQFRNLTTGEVPRPQRMIGDHEVLCVDEVTT